MMNPDAILLQASPVRRSKTQPRPRQIGLVMVSLVIALGVVRAESGEVERLWEELGSSDPSHADAALAKLAAMPRETLEYAKARVRPAKIDATVVDRLIQQLDDDEFEVRERASQQLEELADLAAPRLRIVVKTAASPEVQRRVEAILEALDGDDLDRSEARIDALLAEVEDKNEKVSQAALDELVRIGKPALQKLIALQRAKINDKPLRARIARALMEIRRLPDLKPRPPHPKRVFVKRVVRLLERINTPDAVALLTACASGDSEAWLTQEAAAALKRLGR
jgi:hypothetical protein